MRALIPIFLLFFISALNAQNTEEEKPTFRLFLIGDAGEDDSTEATLAVSHLDMGATPVTAQRRPCCHTWSNCLV